MKQFNNKILVFILIICLSILFVKAISNDNQDESIKLIKIFEEDFSNNNVVSKETDVLKDDSMPGVNVIFSGSHIIRRGSTQLIKVDIFNNGNNNHTINSIKIFNEVGELVVKKDLDFSLSSIKYHQDRYYQIEEELKKEDNKNKVDTLLKEIELIKNQIQNKSLIETFNLDINKFDLNSDDEINFLFYFEFLEDGKNKNLNKNFKVQKGSYVPNKIEKTSIVTSIESMNIQTAIPVNGWFAGDQHVHSKYSYEPWSRDEISDIVSTAYSSGLDWVIITDHSHLLSDDDWSNTKNECDTFDRSYFRCLRGEEIGTWSHLLGYANPDLSNKVIHCDFWGRSHECLQQEINDVTKQGGLAYLAHPYSSPYSWEDWTVTGYSGLEIWNGGDNSPQPEPQSLEKWESLALTNKVFAIANSDSHSLDLGDIMTYCKMDSLNEANIINALKNGRCVISRGPLVFFELNGKEIGETADVCSGQNLVNVKWYSESGWPLDTLYFNINGNFYGGLDISGEQGSRKVLVNFDPSSKYVYISGRTIDNEGTRKRAYTNPIWLNVHTEDFDGDSNCDFYDLDDDNDGVPDNQDAFPKNPNEWLDTDKDGIGNNADTDDDNDCYTDIIERNEGTNPLDFNSKPNDNDQDCNPDSTDSDDDNDDVEDTNDDCPINYGQVYENGCPDTIPPVVSMDLSKNIIALLDLLTINCTAVDKDPSPIYNLSIIQPSKTIISKNISYLSFNNTNESGIYNISCIVRDGANNLGGTMNTFLVDTIPPNITITNPLNESTVIGDSVNLTVTTDENSSCKFSLESCSSSTDNTTLISVVSCIELNNGNISITGETSHSQLITDLTDTNVDEFQRILVNCTDVIGNSIENSVDLFIDTCSPNWECVSYDSCLIDDSQLCNSVNDSNSCFTKTNISYDLYYGNFSEFEPQWCDFCVPNWTEVLTDCEENDLIIGWFDDNNNCYTQTSLENDSLAPENESYTCDYDNNGVIGNLEDLNTNLVNISLLINNSEDISQLFNGIQNVEIKEENITIVSFDFNFDINTLNLKNMTINKQDSSATEGSIIISGIDLISQGKTKTVYIDNINTNTDNICIQDTEIASLSELSDTCDGIDEILINCPGSSGLYNCSIENNKYKVTGLSHSGVTEITPFCGDSICNSGEDCSSCSIDCGSCISPPGGGGGGGGGGGSSSSAETTPEVPVIPYVPFMAPIEVTPTEPEEVPEEPEDTIPTGFVARNLNGRNIGIGIGLIVLIVVGGIFFKFKGSKKNISNLKSIIDKNLFGKNRDPW